MWYNGLKCGSKTAAGGDYRPDSGDYRPDSGDYGFKDRRWRRFDVQRPSEIRKNNAQKLRNLEIYYRKPEKSPVAAITTHIAAKTTGVAAIYF